MIPIQLTFSGLYSYQKKQTVDFEKLMAAQLFGIFGEVGSGKSTILEAVMFVLFDRSDRLNKTGDNRYYNMLNLQSSKMEIDFVYRVNAKSETKYRAYFSAQRKKRDFEKVEVKDRGHYQWKNEEWIPIEDNDTSQILGMTYENFMQTVIIPQGKFREFIDQRPNARTQMLKELFQLHRFDLGSKTGYLLKKTELAITDLNARLLELGSVSEDEINEQQKLLTEAEETLSRKQQLAIALDQQCQAMDAIKKLLDKIADTDVELKQLIAQSSYFNDREKQLQDYTKAETFFNEKFRFLEETTIELQQNVKMIEALEKRISLGKEKVIQARKQFNQQKKEYEQRETIRQQCQDLLHLVEIKKMEPQLNRVTSDLAQLEERRNDFQQKISQLQEQIKKHDNQLTEEETDQEKWVALKEAITWTHREQELQDEYTEAQSQIEKYTSQLEKLCEKRESVLVAFGWPGSNKVEILLNEFDEFQKGLQHDQDIGQKEVSELRVQERLVNAASQLKPGKPCLLCGSTEHPQIIHSVSVRKALTDKQEELAELRRKETSFRELQQAIRQLISQSEALTGIENHETKRAESLKAKIAEHKNNHCWPEYREVPLAEQQQRLKEMQQQRERIQHMQQLRQKGREEVEVLHQELEQLRDQQQTFLQQQSRVKSAIEQRKLLLQIFSPEDFGDDRTIQKVYQEKQAKLSGIEKEYELAQQTLQEYQRGLDVLESRKLITRENRDRLHQKTETLTKEIQSLCIDKDFESVNEVRQLIELELDTDLVQQEILTYRNQLHNAEVTLHKLQAELQGQSFDPLEHRQLQLKAKAMTEEVRQQQEYCTLLRQQIRDWQAKHERAQIIQEKLSQQQVREGNLKELASLFRGSGFVKYASTVLLENLCQAANQRFMKLTQNSLSLELNDENEFVVRDYLNEGKTRLLKTLSGGQTFQASLCLALALAESVKSLNQSDQSFFFLDEGFGALDKQSLRVVFDTLKSLRKENRIVGIISHVEEMQHEIDVYLTITRDRQRGSAIQASWE